MSIVKLNNNGVKNATAIGSITGLGSMIFIKKLTASASATLSFVDGTDGVVLDDTYKEYYFTFNNMHPASSGVSFLFNMSIDAGSNYNVTKTSSYFRAYHYEDDSNQALGYDGDGDLAQSTDFQVLTQAIGAENDESVSGYVHLFNPSSTTFVKHFITNFNRYHPSNITVNEFAAGYGNTTSAVDAVRFQMSSGNIDAGDICLYGIA